MIYISQGDIFSQQSDVLINPANNALILGSGIAGEIRKRGGNEIIEICRKTQENFGKIPLGSSILTTGGEMQQQIIHAIVKPLYGSISFESIRDATASSVVTASQNSLHSLVFPAFGTGSGQLSYELSAEAMKEGFNQSKEMNKQMSIGLMLPNNEAFVIFSKVFESISD